MVSSYILLCIIMDSSILLSDKATMSDKAVGGLMVMVASLVFSYYTVWVVVLVSSSSVSNSNYNVS